MLTCQDGWGERLQKHFQQLFAKQQASTVAQDMEKIWRELERACKHVAWKPFSGEELRRCAGACAGGKSTGPDGVSYEALQVMRTHRHWENRLQRRPVRLHPQAKDSVTILLPKERHLTEWGQTRTITLSSALMQIQLILGRVGRKRLEDATGQFERPGRQARECYF